MTRTEFCSNHYYTDASFNPAITIALLNKNAYMADYNSTRMIIPLPLSLYLPLVALSSRYDEAANIAKGVKCSG